MSKTDTFTALSVEEFATSCSRRHKNSAKASRARPVLLRGRLLESVYRDCLVYELTSEDLHVERERRVPIEYRGRRIRHDLKLDLLVEGSVVIEVKAVEHLHPVHQAQVITYLKLSGYPAGLLMNFNVASLRAGLQGLDHPSRYMKRPVVGTGP